MDDSVKIVAIIQARMGSTRLPGKVMKTLGDRTVLAQVIRRVKACQLIDQIVVATSNQPHDDVIVAEAEKYQVNWFRGSENNVLERYYQAAQAYQADVIVRITADCPLLDPVIVTEMLWSFIKALKGGLPIDYLSNCLHRSYPRGLETEIFTFNALTKAYQCATLGYEKEHVTPYIYLHPDKFYLHNQASDKDYSDYRLTLDTEEDWQLMRTIYQSIYEHDLQPDEIFGWDKVRVLLEKNPELQLINDHVPHKHLGE